jgi:endonuclease YncB( thermonuclease family)
MKGLINAIPLIVLIVLGVFGVKGIVQGIGNREQGTGNRERSTVNSQLCEIVDGSVHDGDTVRVKCGNAIARIRLACIDAPELKQEGGTESRDFLKNLIKVNGSSVAMIPLEQDKYDRTVAELILKPGSVPEVSIQEELLKAGQARIYEKYSDCPNISAFRLAEEIGKKGRKGIWSYDSIPPWEYRHNK